MGVGGPMPSAAWKAARMVSRAMPKPEPSSTRPPLPPHVHSVGRLEALLALRWLSPFGHLSCTCDDDDAVEVSRSARGESCDGVVVGANEGSVGGGVELPNPGLEHHSVGSRVTPTDAHTHRGNIEQRRICAEGQGRAGEGEWRGQGRVGERLEVWVWGDLLWC